MVKSLDKDFKYIDQIETPGAIITRYSPNILYVKYKPGNDELDLKYAKEQVKSVREISEGKPHHLILDFSNTEVEFSPEAREYFAENTAHNEVRLSQIIITKTLAHKLVANFYMRFNKPKSPTVIVNSMDEALRWIEKRL